MVKPYTAAAVKRATPVPTANTQPINVVGLMAAFFVSLFNTFFKSLSSALQYSGDSSSREQEARLLDNCML